MLKLRLARIGRKRQPVYRLVVMPNTSRRNGRPVASLGYYNPMTKQYQFNTDQIEYWLKNGVKPTETVANLLKKIEKK
jgi:small subunit ribosomal protein S16